MLGYIEPFLSSRRPGVLGFIEATTILTQGGARSLPSGHNAPTESWFNSFKNERVHGVRYTTHAEIKAAAFEYIEVFYNRKRMHSTLGYKSPVLFLENWISEQHQKKLVA